MPERRLTIIPIHQKLKCREKFPFPENAKISRNREVGDEETGLKVGFKIAISVAQSLVENAFISIRTRFLFIISLMNKVTFVLKSYYFFVFSFL